MNEQKKNNIFNKWIGPIWFVLTALCAVSAWILGIAGKW